MNTYIFSLPSEQPVGGSMRTCRVQADSELDAVEEMVRHTQKWPLWEGHAGYTSWKAEIMGNPVLIEIPIIGAESRYEYAIELLLNGKVKRNFDIARPTAAP